MSARRNEGTPPASTPRDESTRTETTRAESADSLGSEGAGRAEGHPVVWLRLELHGFGRHRALDVRFGAGLTTLVARNEFGKSTLVAGLAATMFGLPHLSDATKFGRERFRAWSNPSRFEGTVAFVARDGATYQLHRNFDTHEVRIVHLEASGVAQVFEGEHNPNARKGTAAFERHLERLIGMTDREAFRQSFHVAQPLPPPERLGEEVQRLLSGSGQGTFGAAVARLEEQLKERTSQVAALGVSSRDLRNDRKLQELDGQIVELERALGEGRPAADEAKALGEQVQELQEERRTLQGRERELGGFVQAHRDWLDAKDAHERQSAEHRALKTALASARDLHAQVERATVEIEREWPEFIGSGAELEAAIVAAHEAERELAEAEAAEATAEQAAQVAAAMASEASGALAEHRAVEPEPPGPWDAGDLRELRDHAVRAQRDWERWCERRDDVAEREADLARFALIEEADEDTLELLRNYPFELERREKRVEDARRAEAELRAEEERRELERRAEAQRREADRERRAARTRWLVAIVATLLVGAGVYLVGGGVPFAVLAGLAAGAISYAALHRRAAAAATEAAPVGPDRYVDAHAGSVAGGPGVGGASPAPHPTGRPGPGHAGESVTAQHALDAFVEATRPFVESLQGYADPSRAVRDWEEATRAVARQRQLQVEHAESVWGTSVDGIASLEPAALPGSWGGLARYAVARGTSASTVERLCDWLATRQPAAWDEAIADAEAAAKRHAAWRATEQELDRDVLRAQTSLTNAEAARDRARERLERVRVEEAAARAAVEDGLDRAEVESGGGTAAQLLDRWRSFQAQVQARDEVQSRLAGLLAGREAPSIEALERAEYGAGMEVMRVANRVDELRAAHPELPPLTAERERVAARWREADAERAHVAAACEQVQQEIYRQTQEQAALSGGDLVNIAQVELEVRELRDQRAAVVQEVEALAVAHEELQAAIADFQATYRERLEAAASAYLRRFSGVAGRRVVLGEAFDVAVVEPDGTRVHPGQLSQGTQDQLLLALRLAIADHLSADAPLPLILDDPFLNWDEERLAQVERALRELAAERQIVLLSHRSEFGSWGEPTEIA